MQRINTITKYGTIRKRKFIFPTKIAIRKLMVDSTRKCATRFKDGLLDCTVPPSGCSKVNQQVALTSNTQSSFVNTLEDEVKRRILKVFSAHTEAHAPFKDAMFMVCHRLYKSIIGIGLALNKLPETKQKMEIPTGHMNKIVTTYAVQFVRQMQQDDPTISALCQSGLNALWMASTQIDFICCSSKCLTCCPVMKYVGF